MPRKPHFVIWYKNGAKDQLDGDATLSTLIQEVQGAGESQRIEFIQVALHGQTRYEGIFDEKLQETSSPQDKTTKHLAIQLREAFQDQFTTHEDFSLAKLTRLNAGYFFDEQQRCWLSNIIFMGSYPEKDEISVNIEINSETFHEVNQLTEELRATYMHAKRRGVR